MIQWHTTRIPAMVRWRQKDQELKANLDYTVHSETGLRHKHTKTNSSAITEKCSRAQEQRRVFKIAPWVKAIDLQT